MTPNGAAGAKRGRDLEEALNRLDLAQETLEAMDELGVTTRDQLIDLMNVLESEIGEDAEPVT